MARDPLASLRRMLDAAALIHWREHAAELATEVERLRSELAWAEDRADMWQQAFERATEGRHVAIDRSGRVHAIA